MDTFPRNPYPEGFMDSLLGCKLFTQEGKGISICPDTDTDAGRIFIFNTADTAKQGQRFPGEERTQSTRSVTEQHSSIGGIIKKCVGCPQEQFHNPVSACKIVLIGDVGDVVSRMSCEGIVLRGPSTQTWEP